MDGLLDTGDKVASVVGALVGIAGLALTVAGLRRRRSTVPQLTDAALEALLRAQDQDAARHRYRFFGHVPALTDVYVRQQVADSATAELAVGIDAMLTGRRHAVLLGGAGAGKSALVAATVAEGAKTALTGRRRGVVTVAVAAADLVGHSLPNALAQACLHDLKVDIGPSVFEQPPVRGGRWRIMIDGVDEIIDSEARSRLLWSIHRWLDESPVARQIVVVSRPLPEEEMAELRGPAVDVFELQPFGQDDLDTFARRWFGARHPGRPEEAAELAVRYVARVAAARLGPVARVPLLATIAAMVFEQDIDRPLPSSRAELYSRFVDHLLTGRRESHHVREAMDTALSERGTGAARFAAWLRADFTTTIEGLLGSVGDAYVRDPQADLIDVATDWLRRHGDYDVAVLVPEGRQLVRDLLLGTGVMVVRGRRLRFIHQSFAEFFAARSRRSRFDEEEWRSLAANPSARSLAGFEAAMRSDADRLVGALLDDGRSPARAGDLLADGVPLRAETRRRVLDGLLTELSSEAGGAEALRVLRELSIDADVVRLLAEFATDRTVNEWTGVVVAAAVAETDEATGVRLLREAASRLTDPDARRLADETLFAHGAAAKPVEWEARRATERQPLGIFGRQALAEQASDSHIDDADRVNAAVRLADDGEPTALRSLLETPEINDDSRLRAAEALADREDDSALLALAEVTPSPIYYVVRPVTNHALQYRALIVLHRRHHPKVVELLRAFVATTSAPCTFGAAVMLSERGDLDALVGLVRHEQPLMTVAAARRLAVIGDAAMLRRARELAERPGARVWLDAGLAACGVTRFAGRPRLSSPAERTELDAFLVAHGDPDACRRLRGSRLPRTSRRSLTGLAAAGDEKALAELSLRAGAGRRTRTRLHAAAALGRYGGDAWHALREIAATARPRLRLHASARLAYETGDLHALVDMIVDDRLPVRRRIRAAEILGRNVDRAATDLVDEVREERPLFGPAIRVQVERRTYPPYGHAVYIESSVGVWRRLPRKHSLRLERLALTPTPTLLLLAIADAGLPREGALNLLSAIAKDSRHSHLNRIRAARTLGKSGDPRGEQLLRAFAGDRRVGRLLRWLILLDWAWGNEWEEFASTLQRYDEIDEGSRVLRLPRRIRFWLSHPRQTPVRRTTST
ncbi:hypothetical protein [Actinoplanes sp. NPDC049316]|uniref:NACHT domain-containing protein n=1 Tax=Actinoplanes sp. NPDC049316 TaxID=3154727 RepID=UPI00342F325E